MRHPVTDLHRRQLASLRVGGVKTDQWGRSNLKLLVRGLVWADWGVLVLVGAAGRSC